MVIVVSVLQCSSVASGCSAWRRISKSVLWYLEALRSPDDEECFVVVNGQRKE